MRLTGYRFQTSLISRSGERVWRGRGSLYSEAVFSGPTFHSAVKRPGPPDFQFKKKNKYCLLSLQRIRRLSPVEQNWESYRGSTRKKKKIQTRGQGSTGIVVDSLNGREAPGRAGALPREPLTSGGRLGSGHPRQSTDGPVSAARPPACPPPYPPRVRPPGAAARRWPASSDASGGPRQLQRSGPPGAARPARPRCPRFPPPPRLPANARDTASRQPPSLSSGSELTRSKRPPRHLPRQRGPLLRTRTQAPPSPARGTLARHAGKESFLLAGARPRLPRAGIWKRESGRWCSRAARESRSGRRLGFFRSVHPFVRRGVSPD